ncbi:MAG: recombinase family protein [Carnobacterium sp.]|uniref:recombinase family protein n=1 Tax=Carnobacterium sp. TaxID=48221 RepID=UPI003C757A5B
MKYGYARVSTAGQNLTAQKKALTDAGTEKIYSEKVSGKSIDRKQLDKLLKELKAGDTLIVTKMDRIARNVKEGIDFIESLNNNGITLHVLNMGIFDNTPTSKLIQNILLSVADWEREIILERQREGIALAKEQGKYKGRKPKYTNQHKGLEHALELFNDRVNNKLTVKEIEDMTGISKSTIYRAVRG